MKDSFPIRQKNVLKNERRLSITVWQHENGLPGTYEHTEPH